MQLSKRMKAVADLAGMGECLADVGTDHGYIPIYLLEEGRFQRGIAMDVHEDRSFGQEKTSKAMACQTGFPAALVTVWKGLGKARRARW